jgi:hypothetical protein
MLLVGSLLIFLVRAQRPLNTTNTSGILTDPFFIKPTSTSSKYYPEQRIGGGGSLPYYNANDQSERNRGNRVYLPHPNSQQDVFIPAINGVVTDHNNGAQSSVPASNRLHKVNKARQNKLAAINQINNLLLMGKTPNSNFTASTHNYGREVFTPKKDPRPEKLYQPHEGYEGPKSPSSQGESIAAIKDQLKNIYHTPIPPPNTHDDIDFDEKLGVKCTFEKACAWSYDTNVNGTNFEVTTGENLTNLNVTGECV